MQNDQTTVTTTDNKFDRDDLLLTAAQESDIKAGGVNQTGNVFTVTFGGSLAANHNETVAEDGVGEVDELADLSVAVAQAEEIKGGEYQQQLREVILMGITR